ncbi:9304_t:CDS:10, partial [Diversispora eburnea]
YFVRNGYTKSEQIAVITPYLGQMLKIREALNKSFVVMIDERDAEQLADFEENLDDGGAGEATLINTISVASRKQLNQQVILRTIDNFQDPEKISGSIGFLKTENRTNVLLSRAKHGMYLIGNSKLMSKESDMWKKVIDILALRNQVGSGFPIMCDQHPENTNEITYPRKFEEVSPDGGCLLPCGKALNCGHICPHKCHPDDPNHISIKCTKPCNRLLKECFHPCTRKCGENCGECLFPIGDLLLPCGHVLIDAICFQKSIIDKIKCRTMVDKMLPNCEHSVTVECHKSVDDVPCQSICDQLNPECDHMCEKSCHKDKDCPGCKNTCNVNCKHSKCRKPCSHPCSVCAEECDWSCNHRDTCEVSCGVPCNRLPCNEQCSKLLKCGHQCMGICGEKCPSQKYCIICASDDIKNSIVDLIMQTTFADVDWTTERMIVLECGHVFTAETLDNLMGNVYHMDALGNWTGIKPITEQPGELKRCPNCRSPIKNIQRYGRIIKKCVLDTQNKKFLQKYNHQLKTIHTDLDKILKVLEDNREKVLKELRKPDVKQVKDNDNDIKNIYMVTDETINHTVPDLIPQEKHEMLAKYYSIPAYHEELWRNHVSRLLFNYRSVALIIRDSNNPPYKLAYESAVTSLFAAKSKERIDFGDFINDISLQMVDDSPAAQQRKFQETLKEVGISTPKIDRKIYIKAFLELINIQKAMFHEVSKIIPELPTERTERTRHNDPPHIVEKIINLPYKYHWTNFANFLIDSLHNHMEHIIQIALESKYIRDFVTSSLELAEFECKTQRFKLKNIPPHEINPNQKIEIKKKCSEIEKSCLSIKNETLSSMSNVEHFRGQCEERITAVIREVNEIRNFVNNAGKLSDEEKLQIHQAMSVEFRGSGHWYQCPNGHPYTIGECGMAMQTSRCPDCGAGIGGNDHISLDGNARHMEFEGMR